MVGEVTVAGFTGAVSFGVDGDADVVAGLDEIDALQLHIGGTVGPVDLELAYQDEIEATDPDLASEAVFGIAASASFVGADFTISYLDDDTESSTGISVSYPFGPVTATGYYSINDIAEDNYGIELNYAANSLDVTAEVEVNGGEDNDEDVTSYRVEGSYDVGNGLQVFAGFLGTDVDESDETFYVAGEYDLGGGAEVLVSYADDGNEAAVGSDLGDPEYKEGLTVQVSFDF